MSNKMPYEILYECAPLKMGFSFHVYRSPAGVRVASANCSRAARKAGNWQSLSKGSVSRGTYALVQLTDAADGWWSADVFLPARVSIPVLAHELAHMGRAVVRESIKREKVNWHGLGRKDRDSIEDEIGAQVVENGMKFFEVWKRAGWQYVRELDTICLHPNVQYFVDTYVEDVEAGKR